MGVGITRLAGPRGIEPRPTVLETVVLPLNYRPTLLLHLFMLLLKLTPLAPLLELDLALDELLILA